MVVVVSRLRRHDGVHRELGLQLVLQVDQGGVDGPGDRLWGGDVTSMTLETLYDWPSVKILGKLGLHTEGKWYSSQYSRLG